MVNYMIAVDEGSNTEHSIKEIINHVFQKDKDLLYLISVAEDPITFPSSAISAVVVSETLKAIERKHKSILINRANLCKNLGVQNVKALLGHGNHVGEAVIKAAVEKDIHYLVVGRRGIGPIKRIFIGSTSRYILEHAKCNVICIKDDSNAIDQAPSSNDSSSRHIDINESIDDNKETDTYNDFEHLHLHV
ncbi:hypothetical protein DDB_G0274757 [Dictyostelium discoideum AX4]|uniref:UspA domain-containing protein n=1 Tax=Dictyostelium discoideum TaxID=44689 RepID=Q556D4_DICDI|nr:hypothetical protein DDB_G0274757 [Dictyostelium discoideum AX4]EAL70271.1 hypothetical protein DDB_G0274757 [Dictyostelium discoideum AX4]|eukprot:XP_643876.1 hypothetical protein DDB_G0274757 [Dictyostelium discoideum AX4]